MSCSKLQKKLCEHNKKLEFTLNAVKAPDPFRSKAKVPVKVRKAIQWHADRSPQQGKDQRDAIVKKMVAIAKENRSTFHVHTVG